jgi:hypothetical protein
MSKFLPPKFFKTDNMSSDSHKSLPCDFLLLTGNCVVNEAILTGIFHFFFYFFFFEIRTILYNFTLHSNYFLLN